MPKLDSLDAIAALRSAWAKACAKQAHRPALSVLRDLLHAAGTEVSLSDLRLGFGHVATPDDLPAHRFTEAAVLLFAAEPLRRQQAFAYLAEGKDGLATATLATRLAALGITAAAQTAEELDRNGDGIVHLADIEQALAPLERAGRYRATHVASHRLGTAPAPAAAPVSAPPAPVIAPRAHDGARSAGFTPIAPLQIQIGFFRLLQGAAYRSFRESYSAHSETHLRARDLPYTVADFRRFIRAAVDYYLSLGLVSGPRAQAEFHRLVQLVEAECDALDARIAAWPNLPITAEMAAAEQRVAAARAAEADHLHHLADALEMALVMQLHGVAPDAMRLDLLNQHELNRLRHAELAEEHAHPAKSRPDAPHDWLDRWEAVRPDTNPDRRDGSIMPVRFWYERFMPQLLRCASILSDADLDRIDAETPADLAAWHAETAATGAFDRFATDLRDGFAACTPAVQQALKQAWRLTEPYLGGLQKRREREEMGRDSGALSQYVTFIDTYLGRSDVAEAEMRISFPYFIGPAVWCFLHSGAELVEDMDSPAKARAMDAFKAFLRAFATMYPCPYCRYHFNRFVAVNSETSMYPVEFLLLGQRPDKPLFDISLEDRLATITPENPGSLRRFVWKLHNAVSSSIARTEPWFHKEADPLYTTRFWPGFDAELARARALNLTEMPLDRIGALAQVTKPAAHLSTLRTELLDTLAQPEASTPATFADRALPHIAALDQAIEASRFLQRSYNLDPTAPDRASHLSLDDEAYARSGAFTER